MIWYGAQRAHLNQGLGALGLRGPVHQGWEAPNPNGNLSKGVSGQQHTLAELYPQERPGTHCTGGWVGPRAGLDGWKISSPPGFDPGPSSS